MAYLHERKIQNSVEIVLYALWFMTVELFVDQAQGYDPLSAPSMIMWGTMIEAIALASDVAYHDTEACIESPLVHLIILPIMYSCITFFFFVVLVIYLQLTNQSNVTFDRESDNNGTLDEDSWLIREEEWRGDTLDRYCNNTSADDPDTDTAFSFSSAMSNFDFDLRSFLLISVAYPAISYAFLFFMLSSVGSSIIVGGWGAHLKQEFASQSSSYAMLVRLATGIVILPQVTGMFRLFMMGGTTFYIQVVFKIIYQTISKVLVYKVDVGLVKKLAKRDGTFETEGEALVHPYTVPNAVTLAVRENVEKFVEKTLGTDSAAVEHPKTHLRESDLSKSLGKERMIEEAKIYKEFRADVGSDKETTVANLIENNKHDTTDYRSFTVEEDNCEVQFSLGKDNNELSIKATVDLANVKAFEVFDLLQQPDLLVKTSNVSNYYSTIKAVNKIDDSTKILTQHIPMPSPMKNRELRMTQTSVRLKNGTFIVAFTNYNEVQEDSQQGLSSPKASSKSQHFPPGDHRSSLSNVFPVRHVTSSPQSNLTKSPNIGSPNAGSPNAGSPKDGSPKAGSPNTRSLEGSPKWALSPNVVKRNISPNVVKRSISPMFQEKVSRVSAGVSAAKPAQNMRALLTKSKFRSASLMGTVGYIIHPTGSGCTVTHLFSVDLKGTYMPRTVFRYIIPALQGVTPIYEHFEIKSYVPEGMIRFQDRIGSESLLGNFAILCYTMLPDANSIVKTLETQMNSGTSEEDVDDDGAEKEGVEKGNEDEDDDSEKGGGRNMDGVKEKEARSEQNAPPPFDPNPNPISLELRPAEPLDLPAEFLEEGSSARGTSLRGSARRGSLATPSVKGTTNSKITVLPGFAHLTKAVYDVSDKKSVSHLLFKMDFECTAAELTSRIAYREGFGMQYKREMEKVDSKGNVHWKDKHILFSQNSLNIRSKISVKYIQAVSSMTKGSFIIQRNTLGNRPVVIPYTTNNQGLVGRILPRSVKEKRSFERSQHVPAEEGEGKAKPEEGVLPKKSKNGLSWRKKKQESSEEDYQMEAGTQQSILIVADGNKTKKCSVIFHGTFFPMDPGMSKEFTMPSLHALATEGIFKEMHELQQHYVSEVIGAMTKSVIRARNNIGKGSWKRGFDLYTQRDDEIFLEGFDRYTQAREDFVKSSWNEVETRINVRNVRTCWQRKKRRKRLTHHIQEAGDIIGMGISQALGSLRGTFGPLEIENGSARSSANTGSRRSGSKNVLGSAAEFGAISISGLSSMRRQKFDAPQNRLENIKAEKAKGKSDHERRKSGRKSSLTSAPESENNSSWVLNARRKSALAVRFDSNLPSVRIVKDAEEEELRRGDLASGKEKEGKGKYPGFAQALAAMQASIQNHAMSGTDSYRKARKTPRNRRNRENARQSPNFYLKLNSKGNLNSHGKHTGEPPSPDTGTDRSIKKKAAHDEEWVGSEHSFAETKKENFIYTGYVECLINCKPSLVKNFLGFVFDESYDGTVLADMGITVLRHLSDHSCVVHFKHRAVWPMVSRDFVCLVTAKEGVMDEEEKKQDKAPQRPSFAQSATRRMSGIIFEAKKHSVLRRATKIAKSSRASQRENAEGGGEEVKAKAKELEVLVVNVSSIDPAEYERFGVPVDANFIRGSMRCDFVVRGVKLEWRVKGTEGRNRSTARSAKSSGRSDTVRPKLNKIGSAMVGSVGHRADNDDDENGRLAEALQDSSLKILKQNTAKTKALIRRGSEQKIRSTRRQSLEVKNNNEDDLDNVSVKSEREKTKGKRSNEEFDDEAKSTLVSFLGSADMKGQLSRVYLDGEAKKLSTAFQKMKDDLELTTLTAMRKTYKERMGEMNRRLAYKWNQENLMDKCCNIMAALVYMFEEYTISGVNLAVDGCAAFFGRIGLAVALVSCSDLMADFLLAKYAMQYCEVDMTAKLNRNENKASLIFCLFFIITAYNAALTLATYD